MKPEEIHLWDWQRMLIGEVPIYFLLEVAIRIFFCYTLLMVSMRMLGKRMSGQFTRNELAALVSLAAAIGIPILSPDRGLLPPLIIAVVVVCISRVIALVSARNQRVEAITQGAIDTLVTDGVMDVNTMMRVRITRERVMAHLRSAKIRQVGQVKKLYIEANGSFTLIKNEHQKPGLPALPEFDQDFIKELQPTGTLICKQCGNPASTGGKKSNCPNCKHNDWVVALTAR